METLLVLLIILAMAAFGIRYRGIVERWLLGSRFNYPRQKSQRKKVLNRRIEDDKEELARLEKEEAGTKTETGK